MTTSEIAELYGRYVMPTYAQGIALVRGRGARVWDAEGKAYLDFGSGIAVTGLGHCHRKLVRAIRRQAGTLMHVSNLYYNEVQPRLAQALSDKALGGKCFFCNSGAEANEGLIKLARAWGKARSRYEVVTLRNSFHGRTLATLTATGQEKVKVGFDPLPAGFVHADFNDLDSVRNAVTSQTAAILLEVIQGEGGVVPADPQFLAGVQEICRDQNLLLLIDEIQTGMGRTGHWFGYQGYGIEPDAISVAKGLGGGFPIGAVITSPKVADTFQVGQHGSTFGGTPLACAAALAVVETIVEEGLVERAAEMGAYFKERLEKIAAKHPKIQAVRGRGLMLGVVIDGNAREFAAALQERGLLVIPTGTNVIRILPPLTVKKSQIRKATRLIRQALG